MKQRIFRSLASLVALSLLLSLALVPSALALDPNTPVSTDGEVLTIDAAAEGVLSARPFRGTGKMTAELLAVSQDVLAPSYEELKALAPAVGGVGIESVIGPDTRIRTWTNTYPARATALITFTGGWCTGFFIGDNTVATAGHCVHAGAGRTWRANVRVWPGYSAGSAPYGSYARRSMITSSAWIRSSSELYDWGIIKLSVNVGNTVGWYGLTAPANPINLPAIVLGYPGDKAPSKSQWIAADRIRTASALQLFYPTDTAPGESGSAVWYDALGPYAIAIHAYGVHGAYPHTINHGTRIIGSLYTTLVNYKNAP